ncbi:tautomerase family protein [Actinopolyspora sp. H202]|uniref:tautomerase family protein n=1 Tax=Actinopolyspora sp. H202 TaxID=1500456 RepID=UPI003EE6CA65
MPHVTIKHFPRNFTYQEQQRLAAEITALVLENFDTHEDAVSIALEPVEKPEWHEKVVVPEVTERAELLIKAPNYRKQ